MSSILQRSNQIFTSKKFFWFIICIGVVLRLIRYLHNTSLWFDESVIATDIIKRSLAGFVHLSPDYTQTGPLGFYILSKLAVQLFGNSEYALRLVPLLFGIVSILLFYRVAKDIVSPKALPVALALFALLDPLIYYSSELKPYSGDVAVTLAILMVALHTRGKMRLQEVILFALVGAIAILFSNPSVFVLAGVGTGLMLSSFRNKEWRRLRNLAIISFIWAMSFLAVYLTYTRRLTESMNIGMQKALSMEKFLMPFPPKSLADVKWFIDFFFDTFLFQDSIMYVKRVALSGIMTFAFLAGGIVMFHEKRERFSVLIFPVLLTLFAAALHQYPFKGRQILFLVPMFLLVIAEGTEYVRDKISKNAPVIGAMFICLMLVYPVSWAAYHVKKPLIRSEIRPVLNYIHDNWHEGDLIYVHFFAQYEMEYYLKDHPDPFAFSDSDYVIGVAPRGWYDIWRKNKIPARYRDIDTQSRDELLKEYRNDLNMLKGRKRVWIIFTGDTTMEDYFLSYLDSIGKRLDSFGHSGLAVTYLYDLS